ncbi:hypothetical protein FB451DRAFT_1555264 [Mycena latifolia]|nr:hypothetical protein FB451DRAFT_1555264 [Mycena latifolia]
MKHPRFYTALPRVGRVRSNSASRALYTSNALPISFFDTPPPPNRNGPILTTHRLPIEGRGEVEAPPNPNANPHAPLALAAPHAPGAAPHSAAQLALFKPYAPGPSRAPAPAPAPGAARASRRRGPRYTLDVGAYGIPKRCHHARHHGRALHTQAQMTDAPLAVQVGEDAYFIRENAMGVADGVGGWARVKHPATPTPGPSSPSASALFARRLMHFCADEVERATAHAPPPAVPIVAPWEAPRRASSPYRSSHAHIPYSPSAPASWADSWAEPPSHTYANGWDAPFAPWSDVHAPDADLDAELAAELDELADGLDVLMILERAYERTLAAHVVPVSEPSRSPSPLPTSSSASSSATPTMPPSSTSSASSPSTPSPPPSSIPLWSALPLPLPFTKPAAPVPEPRTIPLRAGSSTALVAVLDYVPAQEAHPPHLSGMTAGAPPQARGAATQRGGEATLGATPVLRIAHVGDCMGMLVRGGEVAWRSEEMWWRWNTPVQLSAGRCSSSTPSSSTPSNPSASAPVSSSSGAGWCGGGPSPSPSSSSSSPSPGAHAHAEVTPSSAAHVFTLPVQAGDILILASDGLSDNLWDEDVLEEVGRVGRAFAGSACVSTSVAGGVEKGKEGKGKGKEGRDVEGKEGDEGKEGAEADAHGLLRRRTLAGMLSEALCSRARRVATRRAGAGRSCASASSASASGAPASSAASAAASGAASVGAAGASGASRLDSLREEAEAEVEEDETPFARRARETGRVYRGGKNDDISVIVAVISPADGHVEAARAAGS